MKKLLFGLLLLFSKPGFTETVSIVYPWSMADPMAHYSRTLVEQANKLQNKYIFVLENKPGAGGTVAARHILNGQSILAGSTAFFVRPNFYPEESYDTKLFQPLMTQCSVPMVISSNQFRTWADVPNNRIINIGISGLGATTHLIATEIKKKYPNAQPVPYKSTRESSLDLASQRIDLNVGFLGEIEGWVKENKLFVLGITGSEPVNKIPTLSTQGFPTMATMVNGHSLIVSTSLDNKKYQEWRQILLKAAQDSTVQQSYIRDYCRPMQHDEVQTRAWFEQQIKLWNALSSGVKLEQK